MAFAIRNISLKWLIRHETIHVRSILNEMAFIEIYGRFVYASYVEALNFPMKIELNPKIDRHLTIWFYIFHIHYHFIDFIIAYRKAIDTNSFQIEFPSLLIWSHLTLRF